tara:strand:- start:1076 stop:2242 length:1167 start_codon:yes stop_codon:yes gene_type:complete
MGSVNLDNTGSGSAVTLSSDGTSLLLDGTAVGGSPDLYAENPSSPTAPSATGNNSVAIGSGAVASGASSVSIGQGADATADQALAFGLNSQATAVKSLAFFGDAGSTYSTAIGYNSSNQQAKTRTGAGAMALGGSYASGVDSFAAAIANNTSSYGATGANSVVIGRLSKASGADSFAIGDNNIAGNGDAFALGNTNNVTGGGTAFAIGANHTVSGTLAACIGGSTSTATQTYAMTFGPYAKAAVQNAFIFGSKGWFSAGSAQGGMYILYADTTDATAEALTTTNSTAGSTNQIVAASDTCIMFSGTIVAMQNGAADQGGWEIRGLLKNDGGTTTLVNSEVKTFADGNGWSIVLSADNTNNALKVQCTGEASHNIRWVANIQTSEVTYA